MDSMNAKASEHHPFEIDGVNTLFHRLIAAHGSEPFLCMKPFGLELKHFYMSALGQLPKPEAQSYLTKLSELAGAPVKYVGIGPDREQTILL